MVDRTWLEEQYVQNDLTQKQIGEMLGVSRSTISVWLRKYGISKNSPYINGNHVRLSSEALQFLEGNLLGDGTLSIFGSEVSARYSHGSKFRDFLSDYLEPRLHKFNIDVSGRIYKDGRVFQLVTKMYRELRPLFERWYAPSSKPKRRFEKHVPDDIALTSSVIREWYIGDGCLLRDSNRKNHAARGVRLATNGFTHSEVQLLADKLGALGLKPKIRGQKNYGRFVGWIIVLTGLDNIIPFFDIIGPCPPELESIYGYKWPLADELRNHTVKLSSDDVKMIRQATCPKKDLISKYHVSRTTIWCAQHAHGRYKRIAGG